MSHTVCLTVLTGRRPDLLRRTLDSIRPYIPRCESVVGVVWDSADEESASILGSVAQVRRNTWATLDNGAGTSMCARSFLESGCDVWWHMEDDWELLQDRAQLEPEWFTVAAELAANSDIGQVRLREMEHLGGLVPVTYPDGVRFLGDGSGCSNRSWVTSKPVEWKTSEGWPFMVSADTASTSPAHWTNNPFMCSAEVVGQVFYSATNNEIHAMDRLHAARTKAGSRYATAQLRPGVFRHIGDERSLEGH